MAPSTPHHNPPQAGRGHTRPQRWHHVQMASSDGDHQLEKLEFALAVALTRGDQQRSALLRSQIDAMGGNSEEPGT